MAERKTEIPIPPKGTRGGWMPGGPVFRTLTRPFFKREMKRLQDPEATEQHLFMGFPVAVVTTVGARTGKEHSTVLGAFPDGPDAWLLIASKGGAATHPAWFFNIAKNPDKVWIQVANRKLHVHVESLQGKERDNAYERVAAVSKQYASYPKKTDRVIPVLRLTPAE
jgi:deazaflavin-dependent oxidoreductase (nitroreductase family)